MKATSVLAALKAPLLSGSRDASPTPLRSGDVAKAATDGARAGPSSSRFFGGLSGGCEPAADPAGASAADPAAASAAAATDSGGAADGEAAADAGDDESALLKPPATPA